MSSQLRKTQFYKKHLKLKEENKMKQEKPKPNGQYAVIDINGFAVAYGKTAEEFNKISRELLKEGFYPKEFRIHSTEKGPHFIQYYYMNTGAASEIKISHVATTVDIILINEKDVREFNKKVQKAIKDEFRLVMNNQGEPMQPSQRVVGDDFYFTVWMVKSTVSAIEIASAKALNNTNMKPGYFN